MKILKVVVAIPDTEGAKEALNTNVRKIMAAHGAQGNDYFEIIEESPKAAKKPGAKRSTSKKPSDSPSNADSSKTEAVQPSTDTKTAG